MGSTWSYMVIALGLSLAMLLTGCQGDLPERQSPEPDLALPTVYPSATLSPIPSDTPTPTNTLPPTAKSPPSATPTIKRTFTITSTPSFSCAKAPPPRVQIDDYVRVTFTDGRPLRIRSSAEVIDENIIELLPEGTRLQIVDGPVCVPIPESGDTFIFWYVRVRSSGTHGWVAEGEEKMYYIESYP